MICQNSLKTSERAHVSIFSGFPTLVSIYSALRVLCGVNLLRKKTHKKTCRAEERVWLSRIARMESVDFHQCRVELLRFAEFLPYHLRLSSLLYGTLWSNIGITVCTLNGLTQPGKLCSDAQQ